jgi:hypothetical protein
LFFDFDKKCPDCAVLSCLNALLESNDDSWDLRISWMDQPMWIENRSNGRNRMEGFNSIMVEFEWVGAASDFRHSHASSFSQSFQEAISRM